MVLDLNTGSFGRNGKAAIQELARAMVDRFSNLTVPRFGRLRPPPTMTRITTGRPGPASD
jgi:hypothetical protein